MNTNYSLKIQFLTKLARSLHQYGSGVHELESDLVNISKKLGIEGNFFVTPTSISMTLETAENSFSKNIRLFPRNTSIANINRLRKIASDVAANKIDLDSGIRLIDKEDNGTTFNSTFALLASFSLVSSCLTILMDGNLFDFFVALLSGVLTGVLSVYITSAKLLPIKETIISFIVTFLVFSLNASGLNLNQNLVILSSLIVLIPGLSFTISLSELANKHMSAGTARMMSSIVDFFKLGAGIVAGHYFASSLNFPSIQIESWEFLPIIKPFAVLICSAAAAIIFNAAKDEIIWIVGSSMIVVHSLPLFELMGTPNLAIFLSSLVAGFLSNIYAKHKNKSPSTLLLPSIVFLVPGAVGLKGLNLILDNNVAMGGEQVGQSLVAAGLIVSGLFFADAITPAVRINV